MDYNEISVALKKVFEGGITGSVMVEDVRRRVDEILDPLPPREKITVLSKVKVFINTQYDDRIRRFDVLKLALIGQINVGTDSCSGIHFNSPDSPLQRVQVLERLRDIGSVPTGYAELRRAFARVGQDAVRRCGRPDIGLDPFAATASVLLPEAEDKAQLDLDDETMRGAIGSLHRMARWALFGFNVFSPSAALAAKLVLTDVPDDASPPLPYDSFIIALPDGVIPFFAGDPDATRKEWADSIWIHRAVVKHGEEPVVVVSVAWRRFVVSRQAAAPTSALGPSPHPGDHLAREDEVAIDGAWRLARNFLLWLDASGGLRKHRPTIVPQKLQEKRSRSGATWPTEWEFGREVTITSELLAAAREAIAGRTKRHAVDGWQVRSRFIVRGHWRNQAHGEGRALRRRQWIEPFWKGPEGAKAWSHLYDGR